MANVQVPASFNEVVISPVKGNELDDSPLYRNSFLNGATVYLDPRLSGVRADSVAWIGSPLIDATAYYQLIGVGAAELMTKGGNVAIANTGFTSTTNAAGLVVASPASASNIIIKAGAVIDFAGGWVTYQAGTIRQTELVTATGELIPIGMADPNGVYVGIYNGFTVDHSHWGVSETYVSPLLSGSYYRGGLHRRTRRRLADAGIEHRGSGRHVLWSGLPWGRTNRQWPDWHGHANGLRRFAGASGRQQPATRGRIRFRLAPGAT